MTKKTPKYWASLLAMALLVQMTPYLNAAAADEAYVSDTDAAVITAFVSDTDAQDTPDTSDTDATDDAVATELVVYSEKELPYLSGRTKEIIGQHYAQARNAGSSYVDGDESTYYTEQPSLTNPYAYGRLTNDTHTAMTAMTDYYRWLVGVEPLATASSHSSSLQAGALVRNWQFSHWVDDSSKPSDMGGALWTSGADAVHNILARYYTPRGAVTGWLNEGYSLSGQSWNTVGHRTALLGSRIGGLQYGYSGHVAIGNIVDSTNTWSAPFAAFPAAGYAPLNDIYAQGSAWTVELNTQTLTIPDDADVTVKVTDLSDGSSYLCTESNGRLQPGSTLAFVQPAPEGNGTRYAEGQRYQVEITGLHDVAADRDARIVYTVEFFNVANYADTYVTGFHINGWDKLHIPEQLNDTVNLNKIASILPSTVNVTTENGRVVTAKTNGSWTLDPENQRFDNSVDISTLPDGVTDSKGILQKISVTFEVDDYTGSFAYVDWDEDLGPSGSFLMWRYNVSTDRAEVYQVTGDSDKGYTAQFRYDTNSEGFHILDSGYYAYPLEQSTTANNGDWFGLYYFSSEYYSDAYIAGADTVAFLPETPEVPVGDLNGDGKVNGKDSTRLMQYLAGWDVEIDTAAADLNGDGKVNGKDSTRLMQYLAGWDVTIG